MRMAVAVRTKLFGTLRGRMALPVTRVGERVGVRWRPYLRLPGLRPGERVKRTIRATPRRASVLAADGRRLDSEPTAAAIAGKPPAGSDPGSGLERAYNDRLAGRPSAVLLFGTRRIAATKARRGRSVRSTIRPGLQRAAVAALGDRLGGVAVLRPRDGSVLALSGLVDHGAPAAGLDVQDRHAVRGAAGQDRAAVEHLSGAQFATLSGVKLRNASDESCGGSLRSRSRSPATPCSRRSARSSAASGCSPRPSASASTCRRACRAR